MFAYPIIQQLPKIAEQAKYVIFLTTINLTGLTVYKTGNFLVMANINSTIKIETVNGVKEFTMAELKEYLKGAKEFEKSAKIAAKNEKIAFKNKLQAAKEILTKEKVKQIKHDAREEHFGFMACLKTALFVCGKDSQLTTQFGQDRFVTSSQVCKDWSLSFKSLPAKQQPQPTVKGLYNVGKMVDAIKNYLIAEYTGTIGN